MAGLTDAYEAKAINHFIRGIAQTPDAALYAALYTSAPADDGTGGAEVSTSGTGYARQALAFGAASNAVVATTGTTTFTASATLAWGTITHLCIFNASTGGTMVAFGPLVKALVVGAGSPVSFAAGKITVTAPPCLTTGYGNKFLETFLRNNAQAPDAAVYHALYTAAPNQDGTGGTEVSAAWYARQPISFGAPSGGVASNSGAVSYVSNAGVSGGTVTHGALFNASSGGSMLGFAQLSAAIVAAVGSTVAFPIGQISVGVD